MPEQQIFDRLSQIFCDVFDDDSLTAVADMTAEDVEDWDSLANVRLFLAIEQDFKVRFSSAEMTGLKNVGELATLVEKKLASR